MNGQEQRKSGEVIIIAGPTDKGSRENTWCWVLAGCWRFIYLLRFNDPDAHLLRLSAIGRHTVVVVAVTYGVLSC